jgi:hypothetical protein
LLEAATAMLSVSLLLLFLFNFGFRHEFCFVFTNVGWFISFLAMIALFMASSAQTEVYMVTKDYCSKDNQNNFSKFERDVYSAIMLELPSSSYTKDAPVTDDIQLFSQICLDGTQNSNFGEIIGLSDSVD